MFDHAINEEHRQKIRAVDFGEETKPTSILNTEINAIDYKKCYKCDREGHYAKDCPLNKDNNRDQYTRQQSSNHKTNENVENPFEQLSKIVSNLAEQVKRLQSPSGFDKYGRDNRDKETLETIEGITETVEETTRIIEGITETIKGTTETIKGTIETIETDETIDITETEEIIDQTIGHTQR